MCDANVKDGRAVFEETSSSEVSFAPAMIEGVVSLRSSDVLEVETKMLLAVVDTVRYHRFDFDHPARAKSR